ncbi:MAG: YihY/virulence factor BrkB family protein [Acidimicrobiales bacterium]
MNGVERVLRRIDAWQQRHTFSAVAYGVVKKYGDDNAGNLTVQLTYSMFTTVFPLLLLLVTVLTIVLASHPGVQRDVLHSTFGQFPIVGGQLASNVHALKRNSTVGLIVALILLAYGTTGLAGSGMYAMEQVWNLPGPARPNYVTRMTRSVLFLAELGVGLVVTTTLSGFGTFGRHNVVLGVVSEILAGIVNIGIYIVSFRILTPKAVPTQRLLTGASVAAILWTVIQAFGGYLVGHELRGASATYGMFAAVLGLLAWIYLGARVTVYSAELNVVLAEHLWPRGMVQPPLTHADQVVLTREAAGSRRRPEQQVDVTFDTAPMTQDQYLGRVHPRDQAT